jgi:hypothetical protein
MSMHPSPIESVPEETARVARAAFRRGNLLMRIRDEIGILYDDRMFASLLSLLLDDGFFVLLCAPAWIE